MGEFVKNVRNGSVKGPQQKGFALGKWEKAFRDTPQPDEADQVLFSSGLCLATEFEKVRELTQESSRRVQCGAPLDAILGLVTHQWAVVKDKTQMAFEANSPSKEFIAEQISEIRITNVMGVPFDPQVAIETLVDGARFPLSFTFPSPTSNNVSGSDQLQALTEMLALGGIYHALEQWWLACLWDDYRAESDQGDIRLTPCMWGTHKVQAVSRFRQDARNQEYMLRAAQTWHHEWSEQLKEYFLSKKFFLSAFKRNGKIRFNLKPASKVKDQPDVASVTRVMLTHEYLEPLNRTPRREFMGLSIAQVLDAYELLSHLPDQLRRFLSEKMEIHSVEGALHYTPKFERAELKAIFKKALRIQEQQVNWLIDCLTFSPKERHQLWFKPLVRLSGSELGIVVPALVGIHFVRLTDYLLNQIEKPEKEAGKLFEKYVRTELSESAEKFRFKKRLRIIPHGVRFEVSSTEYEEIDLVYALGNKIYIAELKAMIAPSEPMEVFRYIERLRGEGVVQATRKAAFVRNNLRRFLEVTNLAQDVDELSVEVVPLVVTNSPFFSGCEVEGVAVTDMIILSLYFSVGYLGQNAYSDASGRLVATSRQMFYRTEQEAIDHHEQYLREPPQLAVFEPHVTLDEVKYRIPFNPPHSIRVQLYQMHFPYSGVRTEVDKHRTGLVGV